MTCGDRLPPVTRSGKSVGLVTVQSTMRPHSGVGTTLIAVAPAFVIESTLIPPTARVVAARPSAADRIRPLLLNMWSPPVVGGYDPDLTAGPQGSVPGGSVLVLAGCRI